jgi:uncharacterized membrane protein YbhN (UPF0104 family)
MRLKAALESARDHAAMSRAIDRGSAAKARFTWLAWLVGIAMSLAVVYAGLHLAEAGSFALLLEEAQPAWLALALVFQAATYLAQGLIWRAVVRAAGMHLPVGVAYRLSLVKLLVDQALPSSGLSGAVFVAGALQERGVREDAATAGVVISSGGYLFAYVTSLLAGLLVLEQRHVVGIWLVITAAAAVGGAALLASVSVRVAWRLVSSGEPTPLLPAWLVRRLGEVRHMDTALAFNLRLLAASAGLQLCIIALDCGTVWVLIRSLGADAPVTAVFSSFMAASFLRTVSIVPGGLGAFEAASVFALHGSGLPVQVALAATLMFRGLSFWLPMLPGAWLARGFLHKRPPSSRAVEG